MKMSIFLERFQQDIGFRNGALGSALSQNRTLFNDLAFLSTVNQFKEAGGGKKKAAQIQILFCIPKRGGGTENPYRISPAELDVLPRCLDQLNRVTIIPIMQSISAVKAQRREIEQLKGGGAFSKLKAARKGVALKVGTKGREIDTDMFDEVVAEVIAPNGRLDFFVQLYSGEFGVLDMTDPHVVGLKVLEEGQNHAHFDLVRLGVY